MKIVIDIPEEEYNYVKTQVKSGITNPLKMRIANGTPLPKDHGRLKDIDAFITKVEADRKHSAYLRSWTADDVLNALDNNYTPTIVEADNAESEDNEDIPMEYFESGGI